jgi:hypothetical protein
MAPLRRGFFISGDTMNDFKLPVLGFPGGGILQLVQPRPRSPTEYYRPDIRDEAGLKKYLAANRERLFDPYEFSMVEGIH